MGKKINYTDENGTASQAEQLSIFDMEEVDEIPVEELESYEDEEDEDEVKRILTEFIRNDEVVGKALSYYKSTKPDIGAEARRDNVLLHVAIAPLLKLQYHKEGAYGDSWAKRGELEVFFNISRKFDRLENIMLNGALDEVDESYVDTVADLANYGLLWLTFIAREKPELFTNWVNSIYKP